MIFSFEFVYIVDYVNVFSYIKPTLYPCDEAYLIMVNDGFDVFLDSVCEVFFLLFVLFCFVCFVMFCFVLFFETGF